ncbi:MAG TPA: hypothetical protein VHI77_01840 [Solirubrobacterales bacterium]|nr:hypothetical protein [Solirubrobacterales bacterium]
MTIAILVAGATTVLVAPSAEARSRTFRAKPSGITCVAQQVGEPTATLRCDLPFLGRRAVFLRQQGKAQIKAVPRLLHPPHPATLGRGHDARYGAFTCTSLRTGVTCRAGNGHGFTVGRSFQLTY